MVLFKILLLSLISNTSKQKATGSFQQRMGLHLQESSGEKKSIVVRGYRKGKTMVQQVIAGKRSHLS